MDWRTRSWAALTSARVIICCILLGTFEHPHKPTCLWWSASRSSRVKDASKPMSRLDRRVGGHGQFRILPGGKAAADVDHVLETGSLQKAARNHAAVTALAVHGQGSVEIDLGRR